jgi:lysozyme family protein
MTGLLALKAANGKRWANAKLKRDFSPVAKRLAAAKGRYQAVSARTGVPWSFIAVVHEREAAQNWATQLGQGDPLDRVSIHIPRGRGPFETWEDGAYDALVNCAPFAACNKDWSIGGTLTKLEEYNGLGYAARNEPSPYLWSGTDQYKSGKYVRDGVFDPSVVDSQLGCAGLLLAMMAIDPSITFDAAGVAPRQPAPIPAGTQKSSQPSVMNPSKGSIGAFVASLIAAIFRRK